MLQNGVKKVSVKGMHIERVNQGKSNIAGGGVGTNDVDLPCVLLAR